MNKVSESLVKKCFAVNDMLECVFSLSSFEESWPVLLLAQMTANKSCVNKMGPWNQVYNGLHTIAGYSHKPSYGLIFQYSVFFVCSKKARTVIFKGQ